MGFMSRAKLKVYPTYARLNASHIRISGDVILIKKSKDMDEWRNLTGKRVLSTAVRVIHTIMMNHSLNTVSRNDEILLRWDAGKKAYKFVPGNRILNNKDAFEYKQITFEYSTTLI